MLLTCSVPGYCDSGKIAGDVVGWDAAIGIVDGIAIVAVVCAEMPPVAVIATPIIITIALAAIASFVSGWW